MRRFLIALVLFVFPIALLGGDGSVKGTFTVNGKTYPFKYVYAWRAPSDFHEERIDTYVLLSDQEVPAEARSDFFGRSELAEKGKLNGILVDFNPDGEIVSGNVYCEQFKDKGGQFSASGMHQWDKKKLTDKIVEGKLYLSKPDDFFETRWEYTATFSAPVVTVKKKK